MKAPAVVPVVEPDSELAVALKARGRRVHVFDVAGVLGLAGKPVHQIAMTILPNGEESDAIRAAHKTLAEGAKRAGAGEDGAKKDPDIFANEKNIEALFRLCRRVDDKGQPALSAAFPGPNWMRENLSTDELAILLNLYDEHKRKHGGVSLDIDDEMVETIARLLAEHRFADLPESFLAPYPRWFLTHLAVMLAGKLADARKSTELLLTERESWQAERQALEGDVTSAHEDLLAVRGELEAARAELAALRPPIAD